MLTPSDIREIENEISRIYSQVETDLVRRICQYLYRNDGEMDPEHWLARKLNGWGTLQNDLNRIVVRDMKAVDKKLRSLITEVVEKNNTSDGKLLDAVKEYTDSLGTEATRNLVLELTPTQPQLDRMRAILKNARDSINLTNTRAIEASRKIMTDCCNKAFTAVFEGTDTLENAVYKASRKLARNGITVATYESGKEQTISIDAAVRRNVVTTVSQATSKMSIENAQRAGLDLVRTSAHMGARPSHYAWQGKVFSLSGTSDKYPALSAPQEMGGTGYGTAGGLCGCNCRHYFFPYVEGFELSSYGLDDVTKEENAEVYEATQQQRSFERQVRSWKRVKQNALDQGQTADAAKAGAKVQEYQAKLRDVCEEYDLPRQYAREKV